MATDSTRSDAPHDVSYPPSADGRGSTRVNYHRRPYYLGPYESPLSYVMFGLFKHHLSETGKAPATRDIRPMAEEVMGRIISEPVEHRDTAFWKQFATAAACFLLGMAIVFGVQNFSTNRANGVDGKVLTKEEADFVRGHRLHKERLAKIRSSRTPADVQRMGDIMEEGPTSETPIHRRRSN